MKLSEFIRKSWGYIASPEKWIQGDWHEGYRHCSLGALQQCGLDLVSAGEMTQAEYNAMYSRASEKLSNVASAKTGYPQSIMTYNDAPHTTHGKLRLVWEAAVEELEETNH